MLTIQVLIENNFPPEDVQLATAHRADLNLSAEHGLSFWIEKDGHKLIFDTGKSGAFVGNAEQLGLDLSSAEALVVSHGHYDHGGGLRSLVERAHYQGPLWTGPGFFHTKRSSENPPPRYMGLDVDRLYLESRGISCHELERGTAPSTLQQGPLQGQEPAEKGTAKEILPGVYILGHFSRTHVDEPIAPRFTVDRPNCEPSCAAENQLAHGAKPLPPEANRQPADHMSLQADDFRDEICVVIPMSQGLVVVVGCAHPGLMNMLDTVQQVFHQKLFAVFGGSHLVEADEPRIIRTRDYLQQGGAALLALGHCTGPVALDMLHKELPQVVPLYTGARYQLEDAPGMV